MESLFTKGMQNLENYAGKQGKQAVRELQKTSPELAEMVVEFGYGTIYSLQTLSKREKMIATLSSLISQGNDTALQFHFQAALHSGLKKDEIVAIILHTVPYAGFPKAIQAISTFEKIFNVNSLE